MFLTGCPSIDLAASFLGKQGVGFDPLERYGGVGPDIDISEAYLVALQHPVPTEYEQSRMQVSETLHAVRRLGMPTFWFWPNVDAGSDGTSNAIRAFRETVEAPNIHYFKNMPPEDFLMLVDNSRCILGNSSVAIRECSFLGVPAVNIGSRQDSRERGRNVVDVDHDQQAIVDAVSYHLRNGRHPKDTTYGDGHAGERIASLLADAPLTIEKRLTY